MDKHAYAALLTSIEADISTRMKEYGSVFLKCDNPVQSHYDLFRLAMNGGKRVRSLLLCLAARDSDGQVPAQAIGYASALEVFQTAILVHDDIIDKDEVRRGRPSLHAAIGDQHYGVSQSICLGDFGIMMSQNILLRCSKGLPSAEFAFQTFQQMVLNTVAGEMLDVSLSRRKSYSLAEVMAMYELKTSWYTFVGPLVLGDSLSSENSVSAGILEKSGIHAGRAFQIKDDILGVWGDRASTGKTSALDISGEKATFVMAWLLENDRTTYSYAKRMLDSASPATVQSTTEEIKEMVSKTGVVEAAISAIEYELTAATKGLSSLPWEKEKIAEISGLIENACQVTLALS